MRSSALGKNTSIAEIQQVSQHGLWFFIKGKEFFLSFEQYPWFRNAKLSDIYNFELIHNTHLHWPNLDIDLAVESLEYPEKYPLAFKQ